MKPLTREDFEYMKNMIEEWKLQPEHMFFLQPEHMFFLPSAAIESRTAHLEYPAQKLYVYLHKMNGRIKECHRNGNTIELIVAVPFTFGDNTSDIDIKLELIPWK